MEIKKSYKWIEKLIDKITKDDFPNNVSFTYYGHDITCSSGTNGYVNVYCGKLFDFSFDYWTKRLHIEMYSDEYVANTIVRTFHRIYGKTNMNTTFSPDIDIQNEINNIETTQLDNDEYFQEIIKSELIYMYAMQNFIKDEVDSKTYNKCKRDYEKDLKKYAA